MAARGKIVDIKITTSFQFEQLLSTDKNMRLALENAVREIMWDARETASERVKKYMHDSVHETHRAIRNIVYRRVVGGELNILNVKRALRQGSVRASWRGRTKDTSRILSYTGVDRAFIFRFINDRTKERWTTNMNGHKMKRQDVSERPRREGGYVYPHILGGRGGAARRNGSTVGMFEKEATPAMGEAAMELQKLVDKIIDERIK